jgi:RsiW-degrading membrane proteinase PrsW (M82 family)
MNLLIVAIAPVLAIILYIYCKDEYEKEPRRLLLFNFLLGAIVSILITTILYFGSDIFFPLNDEFSVTQQFLKAFLVVAVIEEFSKYIIVRYFAQPNKEFNEPFDGIIYAVMVSMGFAATENIMYVLEGGYQVAFLRAFNSITAQAKF